MRRFWAKVDRSGGPDACWPWLGARDRDGYGIFQLATRTTKKAHRVAFALANGREPDGDVLHKCPGGGNTWCCNPKHHAEGDDAENGRDSAASGRKRGERNGRAILCDADVEALRGDRAVGLSFRALAAKYRIGKTQAFRIAKGEQRT